MNFLKNIIVFRISNLVFVVNILQFYALIGITESIRSAVDGSKYVCGIFVDLQIAFDNVSHNILLNKLFHYGIRGIMNEWFKSYLQGRKQIVSIDGVESELRELNHGVPQGSVLGPLLFLIHINDLNRCIYLQLKGLSLC